MSKALELLKQMRNYFGISQILVQARITEAIVELEQFADEAESIRMLCDDRGGRISELEAQEAKSCEGCKSEGFGVLSYPCECCSRTLSDEYEPKEPN